MAFQAYMCRRCLRALRVRRTARPPASLTFTRRISQSTRPLLSKKDLEPTEPEPNPVNGALDPVDSPERKPPDAKPAELGPMARRLEEATEDALFTGGRAGRRAVEDAGFSEELKARLLNKIADAQFRAGNASALTAAGLGHKVPHAAGQGTREIASAQAWAGEEAPEDAILRMLNDARKPLAPELRGKPRIPEVTPRVVDMRLRKEPNLSPGQKAASARDRVALYTGMGMREKELEKGMSSDEREAWRKELRERFSPGARAMPNSVTGLSALANERIENAIARGQFKNIPRGKGIERDARADNPFIDTTEYIMNKMIKRQEIVPPWIEKQQDLVKAAHTFRGRLRNDWKRHAARMIASHGGSLEEQMGRAAGYARAEERHNPRKRNVDEISVASNSTDDVVMVQIRQKPGAAPQPAVPAEVGDEPLMAPSVPFRDPAWEAMERSYMELAVANLNSLTRSYNLMAPELAKKPYFSLQRELNSCFADVAPQLVGIIKERASRPPKSLTDHLGDGGRSVLDRLGLEGGAARVYDSKAPHYGLKEMWRDLWSRPTG